MALDFDLIDKSKEYSLGKLADKTSTDCPYLFLLSDFIYPPLLDKLLEFVTSDQLLSWQTVLYQEYKNRQSISWIPDTVIEETHIVFESLTQEVSKIINGPVEFLGLDIWRDIYPYTIIKHSDRELIKCALQIYLNDCDTDLATKFEYNNSTISTDYKTNCGYLMDNNGAVQHWMTTPLPKGYVRYSVYAIWKS